MSARRMLNALKIAGLLLACFVGSALMGVCVGLEAIYCVYEAVRYGRRTM